MKNFNKRINRENEKSKKKISRELKTKLGNLEIKPQFLIIGLVAIITIISLIYFIFLKYSPIMNFKYEGYAVSGKEITENLLGAASDKEKGNAQNVDSSDNDVKNIDLAKIEEQGTIFKKLGQYFIGSKEKTEIDLNYPIYINDKNTMYNLSQDITLISKDFEKIAGYPNISITDGKVYNGNSLERADSKEYIFLRTNEGIYINLKEIKINTTANEYIVPINSLIAFEENEVRYYVTQDNTLIFNKINDVDYNSQVVIKNIDTDVQQVEENSNIQNTQNTQSNVKKEDKTYNYEELLTKLGIIGNSSDKPVNEEIQKEDTSENKPEKDDNDKEDKKENETNSEEDENQQAQQQEQENNETSNQENKYIKPEVTAEEFTAEVYSAKSTLTIKDPTARIIEAPTFEIYKEGKIYLRRTYTQSGEIIVTGLDADTEYEIIGKYIYKNEEDKKIENTFFKETLKTKGYEALGTIKLSKEEGEIYNNKIQIKNVRIISDLHNEVIKGIDTVELKTGSIKTVLKNNKVNELLAGKEITIESSEGLKSNENIDYELKFYDKKGKELKVENNKGKTRTSKQEPKVTIKIKEQDIVSVTLGLKLSNKDNVKLENYKYIVRKPNGEIEKEERLSQNQKEIKLDDLDSNQYYSLKIYADYDLNNNKGKQEQVEIGDLVFATQPLSTLGSVELKVEGKDITTNKATLTYEIDEERTDKRLIQILNSIKVELINKNTGKVAKTTTIQEEELQTLKAGQKLEKTYENLLSNTTYDIKITSKVKPGTKEENAPVTYSYQSFTTVKTPAKVEIQNKFVTKDLIDLDVRIDDKDNAILNNKVRMELRDEKNTLVETSEVKTNKDWLRKTYNKLEENKTYKLKFFADEYNEGHTDATYKRNYLLKEIDIVTEEGITGKIDLKSMLKKTTGKNLVDPDSKIKWYTRFVGNNDHYDKSYDKENDILKLGTSSLTHLAHLYDLQEYKGKEITISFKIKADEGIIPYVQNSINTAYYITKIEGVTQDSFKEYKQTLVVNEQGYVGIYLKNESGNKNAKAYIKDLQIELGNTKTNYEKYKYNMESKILINLEDKRDEIITNDYYIKIYEDGKLVDTKRYEEIPENNKIENAEKELDIKEGHNYKLELAVKIRLRDYVISTFEFNTKNGEIVGISTVAEYKKIQPEGNYIVLNDLDFREESAWAVHTSSNIRFEGNINFNGHTVHKMYKEGVHDALFNAIGERGRIENLVLKVYFSSELATFGPSLFVNNYGTISNVTVSVEESNKKNNQSIRILGDNNYGTIENFIINYKEPIRGTYISVISVNYGNINNGYVYGKDIEIYQNSNNAILVKSNYGKISEIFILMDAYMETEKTNAIYSKIVEGNAGIVENVYTVGIGNIYNINKTPNVVNDNSKKVKNSYYITDITFKGTTDKKITNKALWDRNFQNNILNTSNKWEVDELVSLGYYPWLKLNDCMPRQEYIALPEITDADLPEILFTETLENTNKTAKAKMSMYNPSGEEITNIKVKNLDCTIESQEYKDGRSEIIVNLSNPLECVSTYSVLSFTTKGAFNLEYTKEYEEGEILINVDLYNEIYSLEDWYEIRKKNNENYKLMANLDFKNSDPKQYAGTNFYGILDGRGHTIKNIYIPSSVGRALFGQVGNNTKILNLNIQNYNLEKNGNYVGIIEMGNGLEMKNVNIDTVNLITSSPYTVGGIIGSSNYFEWEDITLNNVNILAKNLDSSIVGGLLGNGYGNINNVYANNINIKIVNPNGNVRVGGLAGEFWNRGSKVFNVVINGNIDAETGKVGGMIGKGIANIKNNIVKMNLITNGNFVGGLIGERLNDTVEIKNNLYIGNIINKKETEYTDEIFGNYEMKDPNYTFEQNKINGLPIEESKNNLGIEELSKEKTYKEILEFDDNYNYDNLNNKLPLLKNSDKTNLLPNQKPIDIVNEELDIRNVTTLRENGNRLKVRLEITNSQNLEITGIQIENMDVEVTDKRNNKGITYIDLVAVPNKYYDNYRITGIKYLKNNEEKIQNTYYLIEEAFYKEITKFEDWQNIDNESYENYRLLTDLDFAGKKNVNYNLKIGRLVTEGNMHTIKNITLNVGDKGYFGLISLLKNGIENIKFENININCNEKAKTSSIGIIGKCEGSIYNIEFNNINIDIAEDAKNINNVGCIGYYEGTYVEKVKTNEIHINGGSYYIGGTFGWLTYVELKNVEASNINIENNAEQVGGIIGHMSQLTNTMQSSNIKIINSSIKGNKYIGGIAGQGGFNENITVINCNVDGIDYVGGAVGSQTHAMGGLINTLIDNSHIQGTTRVGGIFGGGGRIEYSKVINTTVEGIGSNSKAVGGIVGTQGWSPWTTYIKDSKVISKGINVGGILGESGLGINRCFVDNVLVEGYANVGGLIGYTQRQGSFYSYSNATVIATEHSAGGITGYLENGEMDNLNNVSQMYGNYYASGTIKSKENVGGIIGEAEKELFMPEKYYKQNYIEANLISENDNTISLGIGNLPKENNNMPNTYYYKYSKINGEYPNEKNEAYIPEDKYLKEEDLKQSHTYLDVKMLNWGYTYDYDILSQNKYPILTHESIIEGQEGIRIPKDPDLEEISESFNKELSEKLHYTFNYEGKIIRTYETYSEIIAEDGSKVVRQGIQLYVKDGKLYALPITLNFNSEIIKLVDNNFIIDSYNGKEYETVLSEDGRLYDLKDKINYPESFVNEGIVSIGNNLTSESEYEIEIIYKNGDKLRFNYQTGEIISLINGKSSKIGLFNYVQEKISQIGSYNARETQKIANEYKKSKKLQSKLEKIPVEKTIEEQQVKDKLSKENNTYIKDENVEEQNNDMNKTEDTTPDENNKDNETNNSLQEQKYISIYDAEKSEYQIYNEEELLDTKKKEVISENEKIEANNLKEYYASEGKATNTKMGIVWIALSIIGVVIILIGIWGRT